MDGLQLKFQKVLSISTRSSPSRIDPHFNDKEIEPEKVKKLP